MHQVAEQDFQKFICDHQPFVELRQRTVNVGNELNESSAKEESDEVGKSLSGKNLNLMEALPD